MVLRAFEGALGFLSRLPLGRDERAWEAFRSTPAAFPLSGYVLGVLLALPVVLPFPAPVVGFAFVVWVYAVTGINHVDGLADLGDAAVVHGGRERRREVMTDTTVGVGAVLAVALAVAGLAFAGLALAFFPARAAFLPVRAASLVVAAEVGAKLGMATLVCLGTASHEGLGAEFTTRAGPESLVLPLAVSIPAAALAWPSSAGAVALAAAVVVALSVLWWARARLGGVSGDVLGAVNELSRLAALHVGILVWNAV